MKWLPRNIQDSKSLDAPSLMSDGNTVVATWKYPNLESCYQAKSDLSITSWSASVLIRGVNSYSSPYIILCKSSKQVLITTTKENSFEIAYRFDVNSDWQIIQAIPDSETDATLSLAINPFDNTMIVLWKGVSIPGEIMFSRSFDSRNTWTCKSTVENLKTVGRISLVIDPRASEKKCYFLAVEPTSLNLYCASADLQSLELKKKITPLQ